MPHSGNEQLRNGVVDLSGDGTFQRTLRDLEDRLWNLETAPSVVNQHASPGLANATQTQQLVPTRPVSERQRGQMQAGASGPRPDPHPDAAIYAEVKPPISQSFRSGIPVNANTRTEYLAGTKARSLEGSTVIPLPPPGHTDPLIIRGSPRQLPKTPELAPGLRAAPDVMCRMPVSPSARLTLAMVGDTNLVALSTPTYFPLDVSALRRRVAIELAEHDAALGTLVINGQTIDLIEGTDNGHRRD